MINTLDSSNEPLFPHFKKFAETHRLLEVSKGIDAVRLPRILGTGGKTAAEGLDLPPAKIERQRDLIAFKIPLGLECPDELKAEISNAREEVRKHDNFMRQSDNQRKFAMSVLQNLTGATTGRKNNRYFANQLILTHDSSGKFWTWSLTPHYPVIRKMPADLGIVTKAHSEAEKKVKEQTMPVDEFVEKLDLAWAIARHFADSDNVLIADVAVKFKIACQSEGFWKNPVRRNYTDFPDSIFPSNLINWKHNARDTQLRKFVLVPATLNQAHGKNSKVYYVPSNYEGTDCRPMIYIKRSND